MDSDIIVYASTDSIYGSHTESSHKSIAIEAHIAYEAFTLARERYTEYYPSHHDVNVAGLRFFFIYQSFISNEENKGGYASTFAGFAACSLFQAYPGGGSLSSTKHLEKMS